MELIEEAKKGNIENVKSILKHFNYDKYFINNALISASSKGHIDIVKLLLEEGADIHLYDEEALGSAIENGHINIIEFLLDNGADINLGLNLASDYVDADIIKYLIEKGANWKLIIDRPIFKIILKEETNKLLKELTNNYLLLRNTMPKTVFDGEIKSLIPKSVLMRMVYEVPYTELCSKPKPESDSDSDFEFGLVPLKLVILANIMMPGNFDQIINMSRSELCNKINKFLYLLL